MQAPELVTTERLRLRPYGRADEAVLERLFTDRDVRRYLLDDEIVSREWVEAEAVRNEAAWVTDGVGMCLIFEAGDEDDRERAIGFAGFRPFFEPPELQLVYGLLPGRWGRGYATEAAARMVRYAFEELGLDEVIGVTDPPNRASMRVMERLGMRFLEQHRREGHVLVVYRARRASARSQ